MQTSRREISGVISGVGSVVTINGNSGGLLLSGANTYTGGTLFQSGSGFGRDILGIDSVAGVSGPLGTGLITTNSQGNAISAPTGTTRILANDLEANPGKLEFGDGTNQGTIVLTGDIDLRAGTKQFKVGTVADRTNRRGRNLC